ncbi:MAG: hypothetical protein LBJ11_00880 [Oscillospiraceae bacterium]|jgi:DNA-directed RNA polymerase subunit RPC12/RpoP|nr:hypothetical protein [Oscillospiraceae bacterium]
MCVKCGAVNPDQAVHDLEFVEETQFFDGPYEQWVCMEPEEYWVSVIRKVYRCRKCGGTVNIDRDEPGVYR